MSKHATVIGIAVGAAALGGLAYWYVKRSKSQFTPAEIAKLQQQITKPAQYGDDEEMAGAIPILPIQQPYRGPRFAGANGVGVQILR